MHSAPDASRRLTVYRICAESGEVDGYVLHALRELRSVFDGLIVLSSAELATRTREEIEQRIGATLLVGGERTTAAAVFDAIRAQEDRSGVFDEVVVTDDSWFGPLHPLRPVLRHMSLARESTWTMTAAHTGTATSWISMARSEINGWASDRDSLHTVVCRGWESARLAGLVAEAFPDSSFNTLVDDGCPLLPVTVFDGDPAVLDLGGVDLRRVVSRLSEAGLSPALVRQHLARRIAPRTLNALLALMRVVPADGERQDGISVRPVRPEIRAVVHVEPGRALDEIDVVARVLDSRDSLVVTAAPEDADRVRGELRRLEVLADVRATDPAEGQMGALLRHCADLLHLGGDDPLLLMMRVAAAPGSVPGIRRHREQHARNALFGDPTQLLAVVDLFIADPCLGFVLPPATAIGSETFGAAWHGREDHARRICDMLGIAVPLGPSPLEPTEGSWIARVSALSVFLRHPFTAADFRDDHAEGAVLSSLIAHAAGSSGFSSCTVIDPRGAAISQADLAYTLDQLAAAPLGAPAQQIQLLRGMGDLGDGSTRDTLRAAWRRLRSGRRRLPS